jgi:MFS family permease
MEQQASRREGMPGMFSTVPWRVKWLIYLSSFNSVGYGYLIVVITAYLAETGFSSGDIGLLLGLNGAAFVLCAIPIGMLADRKGRKAIFLFGLVVVPPSLMVYAFTTDILYLAVASVLGGVAEGAFASTWNALIADQTTVENRNAAFSLSFVVGNVAFALGFAMPVAFPLMENWTGLSSHAIHMDAIVVLSLVGFLSPISLGYLLRDYKEVVAPGSRRFVKGKSMNLLVKFSGANSLIGLGAGFIIPLIPTWLFLRFDIPDTYSGPLLAVSNVTIGFAGIVSAMLAHRYGTIRAIVMTQSLATVLMLSLAFTPNALFAAGIYLARAALMNMASPILDSFLMGIVTKEERGLASAINSIVWRLPNSASTVVGGVLLAAGSYDIPFFLAGSFYAVSIVLFYSFFKNVKPTS